MSLIKNEKVKFPGIDRFTLGRKNLAKQTKRALSFQEINRGDEAWKVSPGIDMQTTFASQRLHQFAINDAKLKAKLVAHLIVPLNLNSAATDPQAPPGAGREPNFPRNT